MLQLTLPAWLEQFCSLTELSDDADESGYAEEQEPTALRRHHEFISHDGPTLRRLLGAYEHLHLREPQALRDAGEATRQFKSWVESDSSLEAATPSRIAYNNSLELFAHALLREASTLVRHRAERDRRLALMLRFYRLAERTPGVSFLQGGLRDDFGVDQAVIDRWVEWALNQDLLKITGQDGAGDRSLAVTTTGIDWVEETLGALRESESRRPRASDVSGLEDDSDHGSYSAASTTSKTAIKPTAIVFTALPVEYATVREHLTDVHETTHPQGTIYERGELRLDGRAWTVVIAEVGQGNEAAAVEAERAIQQFHPSVVLFVGVAGGMKDVTLGDVVVATKIYGYESGKDEVSLRPRPSVGGPTYRLRERARAEARRPAWLQRVVGVPGRTPRVLLGPIAAGSKVVTSAKAATSEFIRAYYGDTLAVEMEGHGFLLAAHANPGVEALVVRGISDLLDEKSIADASGSQTVAARHAAAFALQILAAFDPFSRDPVGSQGLSDAEVAYTPPPSAEPSTSSTSAPAKGTFLAGAGAGTAAPGEGHDEYVDAWVSVTCDPVDHQAGVADLYEAAIAGQNATSGRTTRMCIEAWGAEPSRLHLILEIWKASNLPTGDVDIQAAIPVLAAVASQLILLGYRAEQVSPPNTMSHIPSRRVR